MESGVRGLVFGGCVVAGLAATRYFHSRLRTNRASVFYAAASKQTLKKFALPEENFLLKLIDDTTIAELDEALEKLRQDSAGEGVGFDAEWKPNKKGEPHHKVALVQLSSAHVCLLIRLNKLEGMPQSLQDLLMDDTVLKFGVGIKNDAKLLWRDYGCTMKGCVELQALAHLYDYPASSLSGLCKEMFNCYLEKKFTVQCSDWQAPALSDEQIQYAACDALISKRIFAQMFADHKAENQTLQHFVQHIVDRKFVFQQQQNQLKSKDPSKIINLEAKTNKILPRTKRLYENCRMLSPDGNLLCTCNRRKLDWYLTRNLAVQVSDDPPTIQLNFSPGGPGHAEEPFYLAHKDNICVVCGEEKALIRFSLIPPSYRKLYPLYLKSRQSHDIVLVCRPCSLKVNIGYASFREQLAKESGISLHGKGEKYLVDNSKNQVRKFAGLVLSEKLDIPQQRKDEMLNELRKLTGQHDFTEAELKRLSVQPVKFPNPDFVSHEKLLIDSVTDFDAFTVRWRKAFVDIMKPRFLPKHWDLYHSRRREDDAKFVRKRMQRQKKQEQQTVQSNK